VPLNHVALTVSDRERSAAFYGEHFGLTERVHDDEHLLIVGSPGGSLVALSEGAVPAELPRSNHFGFQLERADEVRSARQRLREAGVTETECRWTPPRMPSLGSMATADVGQELKRGSARQRGWRGSARRDPSGA
jgi:catechol 2,3-dioxygenase-like lactoylglutathione lyase family enzyme